MKVPEEARSAIEREFPGWKPEVLWKYFNEEKRKESKKIRKNKVNRDSRCEICGFDFYKVLQIHHVVPISLGGSNDNDNIICVCPNCHKMLHYAYGVVKNNDECADLELVNWAINNFDETKYLNFALVLARFMSGAGA